MLDEAEKRIERLVESWEEAGARQEPFGTTNCGGPASRASSLF